MGKSAKHAIDLLSFLTASFALANIARHTSHEGLSPTQVGMFLLGLVIALASLGWICMRLQAEYPGLTGAKKRELIDTDRTDLDIATIMLSNNAVRREIGGRLLLVALLPAVSMAIVMTKLASYFGLDTLLTLF